MFLPAGSSLDELPKSIKKPQEESHHENHNQISIT